MQNYRYSPFSKPLQDIGGSDLAVLRDVSEGWFVDYKSEPISTKDFGKHISAFANQFGGWLFVGVKEGDGKSMKADAFTGIASTEVSKVLVQLREAVSRQISPPLFFEHKVIDGPVDDIGLEAGRSIIVIGIPEGPNPPYIHSSGRIYRRLADSSDPKAESDRAVLDSMWRKSEETKKELEAFILKPSSRNTNVATPFCYVYLLSDLTFSAPEFDLTFADFKDAIHIEKPESGPSINLDNVYSTPDGFMARHLADNDPLMELMSLRWWRNGNVRLTLPINLMQVPRYRPITDSLHAGFVTAMGVQADKYHKVLNLDEWLVCLFSLTARFLSLRERLGITGTIFGKTLFTNMRGATPFVGMSTYMNSVKDHGIPVVQDDQIICPSGTTAHSFLPLADQANDVPLVRYLATIIPLGIQALKALGVMIDLTDANAFVHELGTAMDRATATSQKRQRAVQRGAEQPQSH
jgi:hypothetical protein